MRVLSAIVCFVVLCACEKMAEPSREAQPEIANDHARAAAIFAERMRSDRPALLGELAALDYRLQRDLLTFSGLEQELGGPKLADAALRALMMEMKRLNEAPRPDLVQWMRVQTAQTAEGMFGATVSSLELALVSRGLAELDSKGESKTTTTKSDEGTIQTEVTRDTVSYTSASEGSGMGLNGKILTQMKVNVCPDATGKITVEIVSKSSVSRPGGGGANTTVKVIVNRFVDDDAQFLDHSDSDIQAHVEQAVFGANTGTFVDIDIDSGTRVRGNGGLRVNRRSTQATDANVEAARVVATILEVVAYSVSENTRLVWESGRCVKLDPTTNPAKRTGIRPSTSFSVLAAPRSAVDGSAVGGTVRGTLNGDSSLDPNNSKVKADAKFTYVAPSEKNKSASVSLEARSKRGVAKADLAFNTGGAAYSADGGADEFHGTGTICDLSAPFDIQGSGVVVKFVPSSPQGGSYSYTGNMSGFAVFGNGTYTVKYQDEVALSITATGPGSVKTPLGTQTRIGTEQYALTSMTADSCQ